MTKQCYRVTRQVVSYIAADDEGDLHRQIMLGHGIQDMREDTVNQSVIEPLTPEEFFKGIEGFGDEEGNTYGPNGTAWFYNDETWDLHRLNLETGIWDLIGDDDDRDWESLMGILDNADDVHNQQFSNWKGVDNYEW